MTLTYSRVLTTITFVLNVFFAFNARSETLVNGGQIGSGPFSVASKCPQNTAIVSIQYWNGDTTSRAPPGVPNHQLYCRGLAGGRTLPGNQIGGGEAINYANVPGGRLSCPPQTYVVGIQYWNGDTTSAAPWQVPNHMLLCQKAHGTKISYSPQLGGGDSPGSLVKCPAHTYVAEMDFAPKFILFPVSWIPDVQLKCLR
jgi:hypothetical protein